MSSIRTHISTIRSELKLHSSDAPLSDRAIAAELRNVCVKYLTQKVSSRKYLNTSNIYTSVPCVQLEPVPLAQCCEYRGEEKVAKSVYKLPKIAESSNYGLLLQGIYSIDGVSRKFKQAPNIDRYINYLKLGRKSMEIFFWIEDGYLYVTDPLIETVKLIAYFEEDVPAYFYSCGCEEDCPGNPLDEDLKCPSGLVEDVIRTVVTNLSNTYKRSKQDETPDGVDQTV